MPVVDCVCLNSAAASRSDCDVWTADPGLQYLGTVYPGPGRLTHERCDPHRESKSLQFLVILVHMLTIVTSAVQLATHRGGCAVIFNVNAPVSKGRSTLLCCELGWALGAQHDAWNRLHGDGFQMVLCAAQPSSSMMI
jgi:hypothetical protein